MNEFEIKLDMIASSLEKKKEALVLILNITENQSLVLEDRENPARSAMFNEMNAIKQENIDAVIELDRLFQNVFESISEGFEEKAVEHKEKVEYMQSLIAELLELDVKIRAAERLNRAAIKPDRSAPAEPSPASKSKLLKKYEKNKKPESK